MSLVLGGCHHRDAGDTAADWWHQLQGGEIAKLRPPPPGRDAPYPHVGLTPTTPPELPSPAQRANITEQLTEDRNLRHVMDAKDGPLLVTPAAIPTQSAKPPPPPAPPADGIASASLDAAGEDDTPPPNGAQPTGKTGLPAQPPADATAHKSNTVTKKSVATPETAMPAFVEAQTPATPTPDGALPPIPDGPPIPPQFPGFAVPTDANIATQARPDYDIHDPPGTLVRFLTGSDQLVSNQDKTLNELVTTGSKHVLTIHGYGASAGMDPSVQVHATQLALLRAQTLADELIKRGVKPANIHLTAQSLGQDARVTF